MQGDFVAECFEFTDVVALLTFWVDAGVVVAGTQVVETGLGIGQQVPDDDQDGTADRDDGFLARKWMVSGQAKHPGGAQRSRDGL